MADDMFDDGLVHSHGWATTAPTMRPASGPRHTRRVAETSHLRTPSTVHNDEHVFPG